MLVMTAPTLDSTFAHARPRLPLRTQVDLRLPGLPHKDIGFQFKTSGLELHVRVVCASTNVLLQTMPPMSLPRPLADHQIRRSEVKVGAWMLRLALLPPPPAKPAIVWWEPSEPLV